MGEAEQIGGRPERGLVPVLRPFIALLAAAFAAGPQIAAAQVARAASVPQEAAPLVRVHARPDLKAGPLAAETLESAFGWQSAELELIRDERTPAGRHLLYQQTHHGIPVLNRYVRVSLDSDERVSMVVDGFQPVGAVQTRPLVGPREATRLAVGSEDARASSPQLVVAGSALAWRVVVWPVDRIAEIEVLVDAVSGEVISTWDMTTLRRGAAATVREGGIPTGLESTVAFAARVDGSGTIFDPDPLATSGADYAPPYVDAGDADAPELTAQLKTATLRDITLGGDNRYRLEGPYLRIVGETSGGLVVYDPPAEAAPLFDYTRSQPGFEAVNAYFHIDASQRYVQSLGFSDIQSQSPIRVNPAGSTADDSGWLASQRYLFFGTGGVDDGEDAAVVLHEYGHAILEGGAPGLRASLEGQALHEGFADYWAMSHQRAQMEAGLLARTDWQEVFRWDSGLGSVWAGRRLDFTGRYPEATCSDNGVASGCSIHNDGRLWGTVMMAIYSDLGREITDRLNLLSHRYLAPGVTFPDAAQAVIQADIDHYGGEHVEVLVEHLANAGLVDANSFGPVMAHSALGSTEDLGGTRTVSVNARAIGATLSEVWLHWRHGSDAFASIPMTVAGDVYSAAMPLPAADGTVSYFFRALDSEGRESLLPAEAPSAVYSFTAGPDTQSPEMSHSPITSASLAQWPVEVIAEITDNLGVESAVVEFEMTPVSGSTQSGAFALNPSGDMWSAPFGIPLEEVAAGTNVVYSIVATDRSVAGNQTTVGPHAFEVTGSGVLRAFDPDDLRDQVGMTGSFSRGIPSVGTLVSPTGARVWATDPAGPYPATAGISTLEFPALNLSGTVDPKLVFWHWYDMEHDGRAEPGATPGEHLWDGGNVKISQDGGASWDIVSPNGGYTGTIVGGPDNPMSGQPAFGGFSFAWRREVVDLPPTAGLRIRFDFGTDATNSEAAIDFAGWTVGEVLITTAVDVGSALPTLVDPPGPVQSAPAQELLPVISVSVSDDIGVGDAWIEYTYVDGTGSLNGTLRLTQSRRNLSEFSGRITLPNPTSPGDHVDWRVRLRDVDGNEVLDPAQGAPANRINIRLADTVSLLDGASGSGGWHRVSDGWRGTGEPMGTLSFRPATLASNNVAASLVMKHAYNFGGGGGGLVEISSDDGMTWQLLTPASGYPNAGAFRGANTTASTFDLRAFAGNVVRIRARPEAQVTAGDSWTVESAVLSQESDANSFELPTETLLHANFPDPFSTTTTIGYSLPEDSEVLLTVHDMLGRRVAVLDQGVREGGSHTATFSADRLASGVYLLRLDTGATVKFELMTVAR